MCILCRTCVVLCIYLSILLKNKLLIELLVISAMVITVLSIPKFTFTELGCGTAYTVS